VEIGLDLPRHAWVAAFGGENKMDIDFRKGLGHEGSLGDWVSGSAPSGRDGFRSGRTQGIGLAASALGYALAGRWPAGPRSEGASEDSQPADRWSAGRQPKRPSDGNVLAGHGPASSRPEGPPEHSPGLRPPGRWPGSRRENEHWALKGRHICSPRWTTSRSGSGSRLENTALCHRLSNLLYTPCAKNYIPQINYWKEIDRTK